MSAFEELRIKLVHIVRCSLFQDCCSHMCYPDISAGKFVSLGLAVWIESCCKKYGATFGFICLTSCARLKKRFRTCVKPRKPHRWDLTMWILSYRLPVRLLLLGKLMASRFVTLFLYGLSFSCNLIDPKLKTQQSNLSWDVCSIHHEFLQYVLQLQYSPVMAGHKHPTAVLLV